MKDSKRLTKDEYYIEIAKAVSLRGTCLRRYVGAIIVKDDRIISTGYVGAPRKEANCNELGNCLRKELNVPSGQFYEICRSVHAEENAIINAASSGADIKGGSLYLFSEAISKEYYPEKQEPSALYLPCYRCKKIIINSGLEEVIISYNGIKKYKIDDLRTLLKDDEEKMKQNFISYFKNKLNKNFLYK